MTETLRAAGLLRTADIPDSTKDAVRRAARHGDTRRLRQGAYVGTDRWAESDDAERHVLQVLAAVAAVRTDALVSHVSAAVLWDLPVVGAPTDRIHLTFDGTSGGVSRGSVIRHAVDGPVPEASVRGCRVTSVARTITDLARSCGFLAGVAAGDSALHRGLVTLDELRAETDAARAKRGVRTARDVVDFVDSRSESAGESLSRVRMCELGLPAPDLQHVVRDSRGFVGRVDFWWEDVRVIGEFDGRAKYGMDESVRAAADDLWNEKLREDRLRATGCGVVRWTWSDAYTGAPMATRLRQAGVGLRRAHRS